MFGIDAKQLEIIALMAHTLVLEDAVWEAAVASGAFDTSAMPSPAEAREKLHALVDQVGTMLSMAAAMGEALDALGGGAPRDGDPAGGEDDIPDFIPESEGWKL